jgi:putative FmdB family regulatory protein
MPIYEYLCEKCEHEFEREQRITDPPVKTCPKCRSRKVKKLISRTSFVLKGSGWYSDLYSSSKSDAKPEPATSTEATTSSTETTEPAKGGAKEGAKGTAKEGAKGAAKEGKSKATKSKGKSAA